jgi:nitrite reductase/ring-hydroxylating ferredoxin subunit
VSKQFAAATDNLDSGERVIMEVDGVEIAVFNIDGEYHAVLNYCIHQSGPLCEGPLSGSVSADPPDFDWEYDDDPHVVTCPWHYWKFDVTSGENVRDDTYRVPTFDTVVEDGQVYVVR